MPNTEISFTALSVELGTKIVKAIKVLLKKKKRILILGCSGVGKTQFIETIHGLDTYIKAARISREDRTLAVDSSRILLDDFALLISDTPGENLKDTMRKAEIANLIKNNGEGIINVVSYGYHERPVSNMNEVASGEGFNLNYIEECRKKEISQLSEWVPLIPISNVKWIITLVTKADVWWNEGVINIENYYKKGDYV